MDEWLTVSEVAARTGLTPERVRQCDPILVPEITYTRTGKRRRRYRVANIERFLAARAIMRAQIDSLKRGVA